MCISLRKWEWIKPYRGIRGDGSLYVSYHYGASSSIRSLKPIYMDLEFNQDDESHVDNANTAIPSCLGSIM